MSKSTTPNIISKNENVKNFFEKYNETKGETERKELANVFLYSEGFEVTEDMIKDLWESMKEGKKRFEDATSKKEKLKYKKEFDCYFALSKELDLVHKLTDQEIKELKEDQETINNAVRDFKNIKPEDLKSPISRKMFFELQIDGETDLLNATNSKIEDLLSL
jgi:leucyl aminopeptidase